MVMYASCMHTCLYAVHYKIKNKKMVMSFPSQCFILGVIRKGGKTHIR